MLTHNNITLKKITHNGHKVKKWNHNGVRIYSAGSTVTYYVDTNTVYTEEVDSEATCLSPTTFTPSKSGWTFIGWREDITANSSVLSSKVMGDEPINLYAVFKQVITCTFQSAETNNIQQSSGDRYYNNGNTVNASIKVPTGAAISGWTWRGWSGSGVTVGNGGVAYANGDTINDVGWAHTFYGLYQQTITLTYRQVSASANQSTQGTRYYNSAGNVVNPKFSLTPSGYGTEWTFLGWTTGTAANSAVNYAAISNTEFSSNTTVYVRLQRPVTITYNGNGATGGSVAAQTGYVQLNSYNGNVFLNPTFTLSANGFTRTNYNFSCWSINGGTYSPGASLTLSSSVVAYASWSAATVYIVSNGALQSGISRSIVEAAYATYPTNTAVVLSADEGDDEGDGSQLPYCTLRYDKAIVGAGQKLYVQTNIGTTYNEPASAVYKVQLYNISTGAVTTLGQYAHDWNGAVFDGVAGDALTFNNTLNHLITYTMPTSGTYYVQFRYYVSDRHTQNVTYDIIHCYTGN